MDGKKHWLLVLGVSSDHAWSCFLKEKSELKDAVIALSKSLKTKQGINVKYICCYNAVKNKAFK